MHDPNVRELAGRMPVAQQPRVESWLCEVCARLSLSRRHTEAMLSDHLAALDALVQRGLGLTEALTRLDPAQLGQFYRAERTDWYPLDHAAKIYPMSMSLTRMPVFRLSVYFRHAVDPALMQMALTYTMPRFPYFAGTVKCGFFWHYIDGTRRRYAVRPETKLPCAVMKLGAVTSPALRVVYYQNRVSVEFFHVLTDGTGGMVFLRTLTATYLRLLGESVPAAEGLLALSDAPEPAEWRDDFLHGDPVRGAGGFADKRALQLRGMVGYEQPCRVLHYNLSVQALLAQAHEKGVTVTTLMLGYLMLACRDAAHKGRRKIQIQLPVNMRRFYPSRTLRNFSLYGCVRLHPSQIVTLDEALRLLAPQVAAVGDKAALDRTMNLSRRLVKTLRFVPLIIKRPIAYLIYGSLSDGVFTTTFSNLGAVKAPEVFHSYVEKFDFVLGAPIRNKAVCAMVSYGDRAVLTVTKNTHTTAFEDALYAHLVQNGLNPYMEGTA